MPGRDGTGPVKLGRGAVINKQAGIGRGRSIASQSAGEASYCECPNCNEKVNHLRATPCTSMKCPKCGAAMIRM